jgi:hypothetical protein
VGAFGEKLRKQREQRGIELDAISNTTKISTRMLRALEDEHFDQLPGGVFNKGFVRAYARLVGLDEEEAITDYLTALRESQIQAQSILPDFRSPPANLTRSRRARPSTPPFATRILATTTFAMTFFAITILLATTAVTRMGKAILRTAIFKTAIHREISQPTPFPRSASARTILREIPRQPPTAPLRRFLGANSRELYFWWRCCLPSGIPAVTAEPHLPCLPQPLRIQFQLRRNLRLQPRLSFRWQPLLLTLPVP